MITATLLLVPFLVGAHLGRSWLGDDLPLAVGLALQALIAPAILVYVWAYETNRRGWVAAGHGISLFGLCGCYLAGRHPSLLFFWELSSLGPLLAYLGHHWDTKSVRSFSALLTASGLSAVFLCGWLFWKDPTGAAVCFLVALMLKSAFFGLHLWLPEAHAGGPSHTSALYSGLLVNLPLLLFARYGRSSVADLPIFDGLVAWACAGMLYSSITAFFKKDLKRSLAQSTIENMNFLWLCLLLSGLWGTSSDTSSRELARSVLALFYLALFHHSVSKTFQFLSLGYLCQLAGTTTLDACKGIGRLSGVSPALLAVGAAGFCGLPGTLGFLSESFLLRLISRVLSHGALLSRYTYPAMLFLLLATVIGGCAHLRLYLTTCLSLPARVPAPVTAERTRALVFSLRWLTGVGIAGLVGMAALSLGPWLNGAVAPFAAEWIATTSWISLAFAALVTAAVWAGKPSGSRQLWDCGNGYRGTGLSISGSVLSDPLYQTLAKPFLRPDGEARFEANLRWALTRALDIGHGWIDRVESTQLSSYLAFSTLVMMATLLLIGMTKMFW